MCLLSLMLGIAAPMIVGVDWRLDYSVRSKHGKFPSTVYYSCRIVLIMRVYNCRGAQQCSYVFRVTESQG